jgi:hypothetical protein
MQGTKKSIIHERSHLIPIKKNLSSITKINSPKSEYSVTQNFFDPSKSSPPNDFMNKLKKRIKMFNNTFYTDNTDDNFVNE